MGLIVVGRLAARHRISVRLGPTEGGGVTATVVLPQSILQGDQQPAQDWQRMPQTAPARRADPYRTQSGQQSGTWTVPPQPTAPPPPAPVPAPHVVSGYMTQQQDASGTAEIAPLVPGKSLTLQDAMAMRRHQRRQRTNPYDN
jgi:hypothetical protein